MTQEREHGRDTPLSAWVRDNRELDSIRKAITLNDCDWIIHKYKLNVDNIGTRQVQAILMFEEKCNQAMPDLSQHDILYFFHQLLEDKRKKLWSYMNGMKISVWSYGVHILSYPGIVIHPGIKMNWYSFEEKGALSSVKIDLDTLTKILLFSIDPTSLQPISLRRHHLTRELIISEKYPLGFDSPRIIRKQS